MPDVLALMGAVGFGTVVGQWFGAGQSRRETRAGALKALRLVEVTRWSTDQDLKPSFDDLIHDLEAAALVAQAPRAAIAQYAVMAMTAKLVMEYSVKQPDAEGLWPPLDRLVEESADLVMRSVLRPWPLNRIGLTRTIRRIDAEANAGIDFEDRAHLTHARRYWNYKGAATKPDD